jgi:hypothetical protein
MYCFFGGGIEHFKDVLLDLFGISKWLIHTAAQLDCNRASLMPHLAIIG